MTHMHQGALPPNKKNQVMAQKNRHNQVQPLLVSLECVHGFEQTKKKQSIEPVLCQHLIVGDQDRAFLDCPANKWHVKPDRDIDMSAGLWGSLSKYFDNLVGYNAARNIQIWFHLGGVSSETLLLIAQSKKNFETFCKLQSNLNGFNRLNLSTLFVAKARNQSVQI